MASERPTVLLTGFGAFPGVGTNATETLVPQLATGYRWENPTTMIVTLREGVRFHDGEVMDAEAVRYSLHRHLTMQGSFRRSESSSPCFVSFFTMK